MTNGDAEQIAKVADLADHAPVTRAMCQESHKDLNRWAWTRFGIAVTFSLCLVGWLLSQSSSTASVAAELRSHQAGQLANDGIRDEQRREQQSQIMARFDRLEAALDRLRSPK